MAKKRGRPPKKKPVKNTYLVNVYCTNCQYPTTVELARGVKVINLPSFTCPYCGCPGIGTNIAEYKVQYVG